MTGVIFDIQRFSLHDGPGIRTTVFLKGCPARCDWCHNPESFLLQPQLQYYADRCTGCGKCVNLCPNRAHAFETDASGKRHAINRGLCNACGICAAECFCNALVITGREVNVDEVMRPVLADIPYYEESNGGVTFSGGEPVLQNEFCETLLKQCRENGIHTNIQTAGFYPFEKLERLLPLLDLVMYDIKGVSSDVYKNHVHTDQNISMENLFRLDEYNIPIIVRMPCVKGVNDSTAEIEMAAQTLAKLKRLDHFSLLPYHGLAKIKYDILGMEYRAFETPSQEHIEALNKIASRYVKTM